MRLFLLRKLIELMIFALYNEKEKENFDMINVLINKKEIFKKYYSTIYRIIKYRNDKGHITETQSSFLKKVLVNNG